MKDQKFKLTEDPIPYLVVKMAIPVSIGFFFHTMFNVVDTYFASKINSVAVAAITITFPIFFMIIAISSGTRQGATALIANAEGANNRVLAKKYLLQTVSFSIFAAVIIMLIGLFSAPYLFKLMHASGDYFNFAIQYTNILLYGCLFIILDSTPTAGLNAVGDTKTYANVFIIGSSTFSIINLRSDLVKQLQKKNKVTILCLTANKKELEYIYNNLKADYYPLNFSRNNFSFLSDLKTFFLIRKIIKEHKPNLIFSFNVKPTIFTGLTLLFFNIKTSNLIPIRSVRLVIL